MSMELSGGIHIKVPMLEVLDKAIGIILGVPFLESVCAEIYINQGIVRTSVGMLI